VPLRLHEDSPDELREAIRFTAEETGFLPRLIEKDYFCTVLLEYLMAADPALVFKGGTCLAKVHAGFYRLSEDLDFVIPVEPSATRSQRSRRAQRLAAAVDELPAALRAFRVAEALRGASQSTQYLSEVTYGSVLEERRESIKVELSLREPLLLPAEPHSARSILLDPITRGAMVEPLSLRCIAMAEALAEKLRAALTRREVAIRDYYDLDYAAQRLDLDPAAEEVIRLLIDKLAVPGNLPPDVSPARLADLRRQIDSSLKPVLREPDLRAFDLERAFAMVAEVAARIRRR
jgi:predicted nucleotidyltransferase component of viral defense system